MPTSIRQLPTCTPFLLKVMVFSPESGFKFDVTIQRTCPPSGATDWSIIFHLYKKQATGNDFDLIVSVEFQAETPADKQAIEAISNQGLTVPQNRAFRKKVYPTTKPLADGHNPTPAEQAAVDTEMKNAVHAQ